MRVNTKQIVEKKYHSLLFQFFESLKSMTLHLNIYRIQSENFNRLSKFSKLNGKFKDEPSHRGYRVYEAMCYSPRYKQVTILRHIKQEMVIQYQYCITFSCLT